MTPETSGETVSGREVSSAFTAWNEAMYSKHGNLNRFLHPNPVVRWQAKARIKTALRLLETGPGSRLLDLGCGGGYLIHRAAGSVRIGLDLSRAALAEARPQKPSDSSPHFVRADCTLLPFPPESFDRIVCTEVLEHVPQPGLIIDEIVRVASPEARIVLGVPNEATVRSIKRWIVSVGLSRFFSGISADCEEEWHLQRFSPDSFRHLVSPRLKILRWVESPTRRLSLRIFAVCCRQW